MAQKTTYYCDGCGAEKKEVNHWWIILCLTCGIELIPFRQSEVNEKAHLFCGQQCVLKAVSEYMEKVRTGG